MIFNHLSCHTAGTEFRHYFIGIVAASCCIIVRGRCAAEERPDLEIAPDHPKRRAACWSSENCCSQIRCFQKVDTIANFIDDMVGRSAGFVGSWEFHSTGDSFATSYYVYKALYSFS